MVSRVAGMHEVRIPGSRLTRLNQSLKRRLDDDLEDVFNRACATRDIESARDLLALMEKWHQRRAERYGRERRINSAALERARAEMNRLITLHGGRPADAG